MSQKQQDKEEETNKDGEESNNNLSFGSGIIPAFGAGLQQPTFAFTGGDFSIQKVEDDGISVPTATYADDNFSFPSTVAFGTSTSTPKIQFGKVNTPGGDRSGSTTNNTSDNNNNNSNNQLSFGSGPSTSGNSSNPMLNPVSTETTNLQTQVTEANTSKTTFNKTNINSPSIITPVKQDIAINNDNNDGGTTSMMMPTTTTTTSSTTTTTASINDKDANDNNKEEEETEENEDDLEMRNDDGSDNNRCPAYLSEKQFEQIQNNQLGLSIISKANKYIKAVERNAERDQAKAKARVIDSEQLFHQLENRFVHLQEELTKAKMEKDNALQNVKEQGTKDQSEHLALVEARTKIARLDNTKHELERKVAELTETKRNALEMSEHRLTTIDRLHEELQNSEKKLLSLSQREATFQDELNEAKRALAPTKMERDRFKQELDALREHAKWAEEEQAKKAKE